MKKKVLYCYLPVLLFGIQVRCVSQVIVGGGGIGHSLAICSDSTVKAWGDNHFGQLGTGSTGTGCHCDSLAVSVLSISKIVAISGGGEHSIALKNDGTVWAWGLNNRGQLGNGTTSGCACGDSIPKQVINLFGIVAISSGGVHCLALKNDGTVWSWGYNGSGQLGDSTTIDKYSPVQVKGITGITAIAGGGNHSLALKNDSTVWAWGWNGDGELGDNTNISKKMPVQVLALSRVVKIIGGLSHSLALKNDSTVWSWGNNSLGQLGDSTNSNKLIPVQVHGPANQKFLNEVISITSGAEGDHCLALKKDGTLWGWGSNNNGQLANSNFGTLNIPTKINTSGNYIAVGAGIHHSMALKNDNTVWSWGLNVAGELGHGVTSSIGCSCDTLPKQVSNLCSVIVDVRANKEEQIKILVYPNPISETGKIVLENVQDNLACSIQIYTYSGIKVKQIFSNDGIFMIERNAFASGLYFFKIKGSNAKAVGTGKFIIE